MIALRRPPLLLAACAAGALAPASPAGAAPWSAQQPVPGSDTSIGYGIGLLASDDQALVVWSAAGGTYGSRFAGAGPGTAHRLTRLVVNPLSGVAAAPGGRVYVAGTTAASSGAPGRPQFAEGRFGRALTSPRDLGIRSGVVDAVAASPNGKLAIATVTCASGGTSCRSRSVAVSLRRGADLRAPISIARVGGYVATAISVNDRGEALVAWVAEGTVYARVIGRTGRLEPVARLGATSGNQSLQALMTAGGRGIVAWADERVDEGDPAGPATISVAQTARSPARRFRTARRLERFTFERTGFYLQAYRPARSVVLAERSSAFGGSVAVVWTGFESGRFAVHAARLTSAGAGPRVTVSPGPGDAFLADLADGPSGLLALWGSAPRLAGGPDLVHMQLFASRDRGDGRGALAFGPPEVVSDADGNAFPPAGDTPFARLAVVGGGASPLRALAVWPHRPAGARDWHVDYASSGAG